MFDSIYL